MTEKKKRPPETHLLAQMEGSRPKRTHQFQKKQHTDLRTDLSLNPRRATMRDGCDDCDDVFGGGILSSHRRAERKLAPKIGTSLSLSYDIKPKSC